MGERGSPLKKYRKKRRQLDRRFPRGWRKFLPEMTARASLRGKRKARETGRGKNSARKFYACRGFANHRNFAGTEKPALTQKGGASPSRKSSKKKKILKRGGASLKGRESGPFKRELLDY